MSIDEGNLLFLLSSPDSRTRKRAERIEPIKRQGYLFLCTMLLASTIINEFVPIFLDRLIKSGAAAIVISTVLILLLGE